MSPLEFMQRLAALVPRPRLHLIRFHGVLAPDAKPRALVIPAELPDHAGDRMHSDAVEPESDDRHRWGSRITWALLLKQLFEFDMQRCPNCGSELTGTSRHPMNRAVIERILDPLGLPARAPPRSPARVPALQAA